MGPEELASYVERARATVAESGELGRRNTQLRLVEPFLERLGWDVRSASVEAAFGVPGADATVDYALLVDDEPAVFVDSLACDESITPADGDALLSSMAAAGVEWGILTNGRRFAFVARRETGEDGFTCSLDDLPDRAGALERFTPDRAAEYVRGRVDRRLAAAEALAAGRDELTAEVVDEVLAVADADGAVIDRSGLQSLTRSFVDDVVSTVAPDGHAVAPSPDSRAPPDSGNGPSTGPIEATGTMALASESQSDGFEQEESRSGQGESKSDEPPTTPNADRDSDHDPDHDVDGATRAPMTDDGEYVVRLFDGRTSVCAIGGSSAAGTMKQAVEYLLEARHLDAELTLPYVPDDGDVAVLHRVPRHPNGDPMAEYVRLDAGTYLRTDGTLVERRDRIETLVEEAGLRVMFQGDWSP